MGVVDVADALAFIRDNTDNAGLYKAVDAAQPADVTSAAQNDQGADAPATSGVNAALQGFTGGGAAGTRPVQPVPLGKMVLQYSPKQRGNPVLQFIRNVSVAVNESIPADGPDFICGAGVAVLFLSLKFHLLKKGYLYKRMPGLRKTDWKCRVLLVQVDMPDAEEELAQLASLALYNEYTLLCAFSPAEAGRYLETLKAYEHKGAALIQERSEGTYLPRAQEAITTIRSVNKTDTINLLGHFGSVAGLMTASRESLAQPPGIGDKKVRRLWESFHAPFTAEGGEAGYALGLGVGAGDREG